MSKGLSNKEIAEQLFLSFHTIKTYRKNIIKKLGFIFKMHPS
ncbi:response regulator transcription factor [Dyadobacter subterraneus]|nr:LuxR C-terminal-related transcriptional regulator [Dyadobacter subterraneus]